MKMVTPDLQLNFFHVLFFIIQNAHQSPFTFRFNTSPVHGIQVGFIFSINILSVNDHICSQRTLYDFHDWLGTQMSYNFYYVQYSEYM
uniref:Uncharacterized protein n=1 Tax=Octopus bimaculoides TaxID=37653 RepID=A0A0L8G1Z5_OCTBM